MNISILLLTAILSKVTYNVLLLQAVACRVAKLSEFARTMQAQNNNNKSQNKAIDCSDCYILGFFTLTN